MTTCDTNTNTDDAEGTGWLGREFLTWLVFHADAGDGTFVDAEGEITVEVGGRLTLRSPAGRVSDMTVKGASPSPTADLRYAIAGGLGVKEVDLRIDRGDCAWTFTLSDQLEFKRVKLPALLAEEEDDRATERVALLSQLNAMLEAAFRAFIDLRRGPVWTENVVPAMSDWLRGPAGAEAD